MQLKRSVSEVYDDTHMQFRDSICKFIAAEISPNLKRWQAEGMVDRSFWLKCGEAGMLCPQIPEEYGGLGLDFSYNAVVAEELGFESFPPAVLVHSDIVADYILEYGTEEQKNRWLPGMVSGAAVGAIAMTEPSTGSDLQAIRTSAKKSGNGFVLNGSKTYITNGKHADVIIVAAKTDPSAGAKGVSLFLVDASLTGVKSGNPLEKIGQHCSDTCELFFEDVHVDESDLLGDEGKGFANLMNQLPQERLSIAIYAQASAQRAFMEAVTFTSERSAFGKKVIEFQNTKFVLADLKTELQVGWAHIDWALARHVSGNLTATEASAAKLWHTEFQWKCCDAALQLHGGAGYMTEYAIAGLWKDARVTRIFGGTNEIMREIIGRSL
ncbi:acyl-CoA dehydrogenase family protein [Kordiimonas pumila]|uniref:Acyl-CoA dehydrogenase family protein n=1 Tax=Kordiimonas pumila TaxID=2161677 RepID=A0ABV7D849_9PROT|nr:acyl-CoA dehydrogenase family protein [Kordiimonas pumila]